MESSTFVLDDERRELAEALTQILCAGAVGLKASCRQPFGGARLDDDDEVSASLENLTEADVLARIGATNRHAFEILYERAEEATKAFDAILEDVANSLEGTFLVEPDVSDLAGALSAAGVVVVRARTKARKTAAGKVAVLYLGDVGLILDIVRGSIAVDRAADLLRVAEALKRAGIQLAKIPLDRLTTPTRSGYTDFQLHLRLPSGMIVELQLVLKRVLQVKDIGIPELGLPPEHRLYEQYRRSGQAPAQGELAPYRAAYMAAVESAWG